ncbi:MAG: hypothetical protein NTZ85_05660 [Bacteroidia bacterium]|nr:hypothetical protein [Bacteroidia bacterium]
MKKLIFLLIIFISFHKAVLCQTNAKITNVDFKLENNSIVVNYNISGYSPDEIFKISLKFLTETNQEIIPTTTTGDVGDNIKGEGLKTITWDIVADKLEVSGVLRASVSIIKSEIKTTAKAEVNNAAKPEIKTEKPLMTKSRGGPLNALLSIPVPGLGGYFVEKSKIRPALTTVSTIGLLTFGILQKSKAKKYYSDYKKSVDYNQIQSLYDKANKANHTSYILTGIAIAVWASDIVLVTYKGFKNQKGVKSGKHSFSGGNIKLYYVNNGMQLGYEITF